MTRTPTQDKLRSAAREIMARKGISGTTTQEIAKRADCSQAAIYKHWDGKESLALDLFDESMGGLQDAMRGAAETAADPSGRAIGALLGLLRFAREHPRDFAFLFQVFHGQYAPWLSRHKLPRDLILEELERAGVDPDERGIKAALLLGMAVRLAFFEKQGLVPPGPRAEEALWRAAAAVLES